MNLRVDEKGLQTLARGEFFKLSPYLFAFNLSRFIKPHKPLIKAVFKLTLTRKIRTKLKKSLRDSDFVKPRLERSAKFQSFKIAKITQNFDKFKAFIQV